MGVFKETVSWSTFSSLDHPDIDYRYQHDGILINLSLFGLFGEEITKNIQWMPPKDNFEDDIRGLIKDVRISGTACSDVSEMFGIYIGDDKNRHRAKCKSAYQSSDMIVNRCIAEKYNTGDMVRLLIRPISFSKDTLPVVAIRRHDIDTRVTSINVDLIDTSGGIFARNRIDPFTHIIEYGKEL